MNAERPPRVDWGGKNPCQSKYAKNAVLTPRASSQLIRLIANNIPVTGFINLHLILLLGAL